MPAKKSCSSRGGSSKGASSSKRKSATSTPPVRVMRAQVAPHVKTLSNGQPRPKSRRGK